jgi:hypothetical protein
MRDFVDRLLSLEASPVVTVTASLDRHRPGRHADRIRFRHLITEAKALLSALPDDESGRRIAEHLDEAVAGADLGTGAHGIVVVATAGSAEVRTVPFPIRDGVSLDATPATRFLVQGLRRSPRYRVLVISDRATRLFEAARDDLVEIEDHGFPMSSRIASRDRRATGGAFARAAGRDDSELWRRFYRDIDRALSMVSRDDVLPLVLVGVRRSTQRFLDVSHNAALVIGQVDGAHDRSSPSALGRIAWPIMQAELERRRAAARDELARATGRGAAVTGIDEVWQLGRAKRGRLLVVEEDYRYRPAREIDGRLVPASDEAGDADVIADPVDEIVEHVLRAGGAVEFVAPDVLADLDRIGLILR